MNEFNVAKTLVVSRMIADRGIPLESVLQVWWSSVWTKETLKFFLDTVGDILKAGSEEELAPFRKNHESKFLAECKEKLGRDPVYAENRPFFLPKGDRSSAGQKQYNPQNVTNEKVRSYLHHWNITPPITCKEARSKWLENIALQNGKVFGSVARDEFDFHLSLFKGPSQRKIL